MGKVFGLRPITGRRFNRTKMIRARFRKLKKIDSSDSYPSFFLKFRLMKLTVTMKYKNIYIIVAHMNFVLDQKVVKFK